jgi:hypothetical protein
MPDLGTRGNVMGPQPIGRRVSAPAEMTAAAEDLLKMILAGKSDNVAALARSECVRDVTAFAAVVAESSCDGFEIIANARVGKHYYYVKARFHGVHPLTVQFRLGQDEGRWMVWELMNLTGRRGAWTR